MNKYEEVWIRAWIASMGTEVTAERATIYANKCLDDFIKRFDVKRERINND